jgi:hypothetical protein
MFSYFKLVPLLVLFFSQPFHVYASPTDNHNVTIARRQTCKSSFDFCAQVISICRSSPPLGNTVVSNHLVSWALSALITALRIERLLVLPRSFTEPLYLILPIQVARTVDPAKRSSTRPTAPILLRRVNSVCSFLTLFSQLSDRYLLGIS